MGRGKTTAQNRAEKECRAGEGQAQAALVYDGPDCVGWCQFGPVDELLRIKHRRAYVDGRPAPPDWRITCFFVGKQTRGQGVASTRTRWGCIQSGNVYVRLITASGGVAQTSIVDTKYDDSVGGQQVVLYHLHGLVSTYQENQKLAVYAEAVVSRPAGHPVVMRARVAHFQVARVR